MAPSATAPDVDLELARRELLYNTPLYAKTCVRIVAKSGDVVPLVPKRAQLKMDEALEEQRAAGKPMRGIVLKARQGGISTWTATKISQRVTQQYNRRALVMAHKGSAAGNLLGMYETIYSELPDDPELAVKPQVAHSRRERLLYFANPSRYARQQGDRGLNSFVMAQTAGDARDADASRSYTYHYVHASEVAFWADAKQNLTALMQTVPNEPETLIVLESTAKGYGYFRDLWLAAEQGKSDFTPIFIAWFEEPGYAMPLSPEEAAEFEVGRGPDEDNPEWYEDEPALVEEFGCTLEQLKWRRWAIRNLAQGDLRTFHQEYPATPEEAFLSTGDSVFSLGLIRKMDRGTVAPVEQGSLEGDGFITRRVPGGTAEVPKKALWTPRRTGEWSVWERPQPRDRETPAGQYVITLDPADPSEADVDENAWHAIEVMDHRTRMQCAEYVSRADDDIVALNLYLAALWYGSPGHMPWVAVETTGGHGDAVMTILRVRYQYPFLYRRRPATRDNPREKKEYGWSTDPRTKPLMIATLKETLRTETHGVRSKRLAREYRTFVRDHRGRAVPEKGENSDCLMAWGIGHMVAQEKPFRRDRVPGAVHAVADRIRNPVTGY